ncbi:MAG TPA: phage tail protein [Candidatus Angelobacter sp.]|nr:phage tail protein [Candidatus Angelobacter sp.]
MPRFKAVALAFCLLAILGLSLRGISQNSGRVPGTTTFGLMVDGRPVGTFTRMGALRGDDDQSAGSQPRSVTLSDCDRVCTANVLNWYREAQEAGSGAKRPATITIYGVTGHEVARYNLGNAWPIKVTTATNARAHEPLVTLELGYESLRKAE